ncbi:hypothetical protein XENORESO_012548, partial [Xenotaenia resolanae]
FSQFLSLSRYNQINAISLACSTGVEGCRELASGWFKEWMNNPAVNNINANLKSTVYCTAIAAGGDEEWDFVWKMYKNATIASEVDKLMHALSCTKEPWLLNRYLQYCLDPEKIRKQDVSFTFIYIAQNPIGQPLAWDFIRSNWDYIFNEYGRGSISFGSIIYGLTERFSSEFDYKQLKLFKEEVGARLDSAAAIIEHVLERTKANMNWVALNKKPLSDWLISQTSKIL